MADNVFVELKFSVPRELHDKIIELAEQRKISIEDVFDSIILTMAIMVDTAVEPDKPADTKIKASKRMTPDEVHPAAGQYQDAAVPFRLPAIAEPGSELFFKGVIDAVISVDSDSDRSPIYSKSEVHPESSYQDSVMPIPEDTGSTINSIPDFGSETEFY